jgi:hypothetical protein
MKNRTLLVLLPVIAFACKSQAPETPAPTRDAPAAVAKRELPPAAMDMKAKPTPTNEKGQIEIRANEKGFAPSRIWVEEGKPVKLVFVREVEKTCMDGVVFPDLGIEKKLEVGQPVEVEFTPDKEGTITFHCPMGHGKSSIVVLPKAS